MRKLIVAIASMLVLATPAAETSAQTIPVPAPTTAAACVPRRDNFLPPVIGAGATCDSALISESIDPVMRRRGEVWLFDGVGNTCVEITVRSRAFDAYVETGLWFGTGYYPVRTRDDDGAGGRDARVRAYIPHNGMQFIAVSDSPKGGRALGGYTLSLERVSCAGVR